MRQFTLILVIAFLIPDAHGQVAWNLLLRTARITNPAVGTGTGFFIDVDGEQFMVTAKHMLNTLGAGNSLNITHPETLQELSVKIVEIVTVGTTDVAAIKFEKRVFENPEKYPVETSGFNPRLGEQVLFAGFPLGFKDQVSIGPAVKDKYLVPFVKRGSFAMIVHSGTDQRMFLDGVNTPGFSGGPIFVTNPDGKTFILGVISGYVDEPKSVKFLGKNTDFVVGLNSGIILAHPIGPVVESIRSTASKK